MLTKRFFLVLFLVSSLLCDQSKTVEPDNCYVSVNFFGTTCGLPKTDYFLENPTKSAASLLVCGIISFICYKIYQAKKTDLEKNLKKLEAKLEARFQEKLKREEKKLKKDRKKLEQERKNMKAELEEAQANMEIEFEALQQQSKEALQKEYQQLWNTEWQKEVERLQKAHSEAQEMTKSNVKIYLPGEIQTTFEDIAGMENAKDDLQDILKYLQDSQSFKLIGANIPKGVLLSGPPGVGKTLLARGLAGEVKCPLLYISASAFTEIYIGRGAARIRDLFKVARELAPCIIVIDEFDALAHRRDSGGGGAGETEHVQTLNQLLAEMDGFEQNENPIVVIAATNRVDSLDPAVLRPGRFDKQIAISLPSIIDRRKIINICLGKVKHADNINVDLIARGTVGFSGAELAQLINEAALIALRLNEDMVTMEHLDESRDVMIMGGKEHGKSMELTKEDLWQTAVHEAGHALMYVYEKHAAPLYKVTIRPRGRALGITYGMYERDQYSTYKENMIAQICVCLGGSVAEELVYGGRGSGISNDLEIARAIAKRMVMRFGMAKEFKDVSFSEYIGREHNLPAEISKLLHQEIAKIIHECREHVTKVLQKHSKELDEVANQLMLKGTLFGSEVYQICGETEPSLEYSFVDIP